MSDVQTVPRHWVITASADRVRSAVAGGFTQADHGRSTRLHKLRRGDGLVFYSPREQIGTGRPLQHLTALGVVVDDEPHQVEVAPDLRPWRRHVAFEQVASVPIRPLAPLLGFVTDEQRWGLPFRQGLLEITAGDFGVLAGALRDAAWVPTEYSASGRSARA